MGSAIAVNGADISTGEWLDPVAIRIWVVQVVVEQPGPTLSNTEHFPSIICGTVDDCFDAWIQAGHITTTGEDPDAHQCLLSVHHGRERG